MCYLPECQTKLGITLKEWLRRQPTRLGSDLRQITEELPVVYYLSGTDLFISEGPIGVEHAIIECARRDTASSTCQITFSLEDDLYILATFNKRFLRDWLAIQEFVTQTISSWRR